MVFYFGAVFNIFLAYFMHRGNVLSENPLIPANLGKLSYVAYEYYHKDSVKMSPQWCQLEGKTVFHLI